MNSSTLDRIQKEIRESVQRERELRNGYAAKMNSKENNIAEASEKRNSQQNGTQSKPNGFRRFTQNVNAKGVMHKFIKSRGHMSSWSINETTNSDPLFKPAKIFVEKGKPLRNGYVSAEEKMRKELQDFQTREAELRQERRKSQPDLMAALRLEEDEFNECDLLSKPAKSVASRYSSSDDGFDESRSGCSSLKPSRSLAELCIVSDEEEIGLPGTHSLIMQFENMKYKN